MTEPAATTSSLTDAAYQACLPMGDEADRATDDLAAAWAGFMAIADVADFPQARAVAAAIGHLIRLLVGLEMTNGAKAITVPPPIAEAFAPHLAEIQASGRSSSETITTRPRGVFFDVGRRHAHRPRRRHHRSR